MRTRSLFAALLAAGCLALPAGAQAAAVGTVSGAPGSYAFDGTAERNELRFDELDGSAQFLFEELDSADTIASASPSCSLQGARQAVCTYQPASPGAVTLRTGGGDDAVLFATGGFSVNVTVEAGPGNDVILADDGSSEVVDCGAGSDLATVDPGDVVIDCETGIRDADGDGSTAPFDCDDGNPAIRPGLVDEPGNGVDEDCSGRDEALARLDTRASAGWRVFRRYTSVARLLSVGPVPAGATVRLRCSGRGCPFSSRRRRVTRKTDIVNFARAFRKRKLRPGAVIQIRVTRPATIGRVFRWRVRRGRLPALRSLCLRPGAPRAEAC